MDYVEAVFNVIVGDAFVFCALVWMSAWLSRQIIAATIAAALDGCWYKECSFKVCM